MTREPSPLRQRLQVAFVAVAVVAVLLVTVAAMIGSQRGIAATTARLRTAEQLASMAADAYARADGWTDADFQPVLDSAMSQGARVQVFSLDGQPQLTAMGLGRMGGGYEQPVLVDGREVGTIRVGFAAARPASGRGIAWTWILVAAAAAVVVAAVAGWWAARLITGPITQLTEAAAAFAAGDRQARASVNSPGEIGDLARTFDDAVTTVAREERARRNLSADVAHELRTPLTALLAGLEEVRDGHVPADGQALTRLHDQALRLQRVVSDLADLAAAEAPSPQAQCVAMDLAACAEDSASSRRAQLRAAGVQLFIDNTEPVEVTADPDRVDQVMGNLLSNAARYAGEGSRVVVRTYGDAGWGVLEVEDDGPGVPAEDLPRLFERFWRAGPSSGGSGLGLAIVAELVRAQRGMVEAQSEGRGLLVRVRLPGVSAVDQWIA